MRFVRLLHPDTTRSTLDIEYGTSDVVELLRDRNFKVQGIGISGAVAESASLRFTGDSDVSISEGAADLLSYPASNFDLITNVTMLRHVVESGLLKRTLSSIRAMLTTGGDFAVLEIAPTKNVEHAGVHYRSRTDGLRVA